MINHLNHTDLIDIIRTLLAFIMVNQNHLFSFCSNVLHQTRRFYPEVIEGELSLSADVSKPDRLSIPAQFLLQCRISNGRADRICIRVFVTKDQSFCHFQSPYYVFVRIIYHTLIETCQRPVNIRPGLTLGMLLHCLYRLTPLRLRQRLRRILPV